MGMDVASRLDVMNRNIILIREYLEDIMLSRGDLDALSEADGDLSTGKTKRLV